MNNYSSASIVSKVWKYAHVLKSAGVSYGDYVMSEGAGRETIYRFKGTAKITSEDVFSQPNSPNLDPSSPNLDPNSPNLDPQSPSRDEKGRLISKHFALPFVDGIPNFTEAYRSELEEHAKEPRESGKISRERMIEIFVNLCEGHYIRLDCLATLVNRKSATLQGQYLTQLCRDRTLKMAFQDNPNDPRQSYTKG